MKNTDILYSPITKLAVFKNNQFTELTKRGKWMYFCDGEWSYSYYLDEHIKSKIIKEITEEEMVLLVE